LAPDLPPALVGDPGRLRQVLVNLVGNAVKFTDKGGIVVSVQKAEVRGQRSEPGVQWSDVYPLTSDVCEVQFIVRDTSIGRAPDDLARIFAPFEQADQSAARRFDGTGLGLSIAARLVELMGGRIEVNSAPGRGSTFRFSARFAPVEYVPP